MRDLERISQTTHVSDEAATRVGAAETVGDDPRLEVVVVRSVGRTPGRPPRPRANSYSRPTDKNMSSPKPHANMFSNCARVILVIEECSTSGAFGEMRYSVTR